MVFPVTDWGTYSGRFFGCVFHWCRGLLAAQYFLMSIAVFITEEVPAATSFTAKYINARAFRREIKEGQLALERRGVS